MSRGERASLPKSGTILVTPGWFAIEKMPNCHPQLLLWQAHWVESYHRGTKRVDISVWPPFTPHERRFNYI